MISLFYFPRYVLSALSQQTHKSPPIYFYCPDKHNTLHRIIFDREEDGKGNNLEPTINMKKPSVYIIYYPDDIYHRNVVRHLADFLKRVGCCDVRIDMLDAKIIMQLSKPTYVVQQWKTARCKFFPFFVLSFTIQFRFLSLLCKSVKFIRSILWKLPKYCA